MLKIKYLPVIIILITLSACTQQMPINPTPVPSNGIEGQVTEGPMCPGPVSIGESQCQDQPYQATIIVLDENNNKVTQFQTDLSGNFKISLAPGTYGIHPESDNTFPRAADQLVVVISNQFTQMTIIYDTGMR